MKNLFRKLAALSLTAVTMLAGCGDYLDAPDKPQEPTYSTLQVYTDPVTSEHVSDTTTARSTIASTARQTSKAITTTAKQSTKSQKTTTRSSKTTAAVKTTEAVTTSTVSEDYVEYHSEAKNYWNSILKSTVRSSRTISDTRMLLSMKKAQVML